MSTHLAIAAVSAALRSLCEEAVQVLPGARATYGRAGPRPSNAAGIRLCLYQAVPNEALRSQALPSRRPDGTIRETSMPAQALDLTYLLTCGGDDRRLEPEQLLGSLVASLGEVPAFSAERLHAALRGALPDRVGDAPPTTAPVPLTLRTDAAALHQAWGALFGTDPYQPSLLVQATGVLIQRVAHVIAPAPIVGAAVAVYDDEGLLD